MTYPLISQYVESILSAEDNFDKLTNLRPVLGADGKLVMTSGNFAVVFKMKDEQTGKLYAVKCFLKDQPNRAESYRMIADELEYVSSTFLTKFKYLDKELFVDSSNTDDTEFPVLLMDWVDGVNLDQYLRQHLGDQYALRMLAYQFSKLAMWLMPQPFAHGDIKPDNIMVRNDGSLVLIDYDGMYVPAMAGQKARELGSPDFRHPSRTEDVFNEHIDDFSLASMLLSLRTIANDPSLLDKYGASDRLLFSEADYRDIHSCQFLKDLYPSAENEINTLVSLFTLALTQDDLAKVSFRLLSLQRPDSNALSKGKPKKSERPSHDQLAKSTGNPIIDNLIRNMVFVEGGTFLMGATAEQGVDAFGREKPAHQVSLSSFHIGKYEVTQWEWQAVMGSNPSKFKGDDRPVEQVSWNDCQEFIKKLNSISSMNFRLPTEAEWEFAARGGNKSRGYKYAGSNNIDEVAWYWFNCDSKTHSVGQKQPNELGLFDMSGNVWEWCQDRHGDYRSSAQVNPTGPTSGSDRVNRGGCWGDVARFCRVSHRDYFTPDGRFSYLGLRLAL